MAELKKSSLITQSVEATSSGQVTKIEAVQLIWVFLLLPSLS